jgi:hypothetical protein
MARSQLIFAAVASCLAALLLVALVAWLTSSSSWSASRIPWLDLGLILPLLVAEKAGLERVTALVVAFLTYWLVVLGAVTWYIKRNALELRT